MRILILEDDPILLRSFDRQVVGMGHETYCASTAIQALDIVHSQPLLHLALLDWELGTPLTGLNVARHLIRIGVPVIVISGHSKEEIRGNWLDPLSGVLDFEQKPVEWARLKDRIERVERSMHDTDPEIRK